MSKSFVFYEDWLLAAETIDDPVLRCEFFQAIATYALRGEAVESSPELRIAFQMVKGQIVRDKEKYNDKVEKRRAAAYASHAGSTKSANAANAAVNCIDIATANGSVNVDENACISDANKDKTFPPPNGGVKDDEDYLHCLEQITNICVPELVEKAHYENQYIWRVLDFGSGYAEIVSDLSQRGLSTEVFARSLQTLNEQFKPLTDFQVIKLGRAISKMSPEYQKAFLAEYHRSMHEPSIIHVLLQKAEYIRYGNKITSLVGFLKARG